MTSQDDLNRTPPAEGPETPEEKVEQTQQPDEDGAIPIPVRVGSRLEKPEAPAEPAAEAPSTPPNGGQNEEDDPLVREYEQRYYGTRSAAQGGSQGGYYYAEPRKRKNDDSSMWQRFRSQFDNYNLPPRHRYPTRPSPGMLQENERLWAMLAHASSVLTFLIMFTTGGVGTILSVLVPMGIYLYYRKRSEFVAFHALQAFTMQVLGTVGFFLVVVVGSIAFFIAMIVMAITIIGIPIALILFLVWILFIIGTFIMPLGMLVYGVIAAFSAWDGKYFRYPYVADWVDDQLNNGFLRRTA
jgi:uncharacterized Tic20 family protein